MAQANSVDLPKVIVISAVNLNRGGTLRILRDCLTYLSSLNTHQNYRIIAVVYDKSLCDFPNIEYIETKWPKKRWVNRLWFEYVSMKKISRKLQPIALWLSLHDTSPTVKAEKRAVYCHNSFPFLKWNFRDLVFAPNIVLFALFSKFFYRVNIHQNDFVIVQQEWFRTAFIKLFNLNRTQIIVSPPDVGTSVKQNDSLEIPSAEHNGIYTFIYPAIADSHKNFECICRAAELLWKKGVRNFRVLLTIKGDENRYAKWLYANWGKDIPTIEFLGYLDRSTLFSFYEKAQSLIFASKVETWGLPITEFSAFKKPMLLADLPYARETAQGADMVVFFDVNSPDILANYMQELIEGNTTSVHSLDKLPLQEPYAVGWPSLFSILLS